MGEPDWLHCKLLTTDLIFGPLVSGSVSLWQQQASPGQRSASFIVKFDLKKPPTGLVIKMYPCLFIMALRQWDYLRCRMRGVFPQHSR